MEIPWCNFIPVNAVIIVTKSVLGVVTGSVYFKFIEIYFVTTHRHPTAIWWTKGDFCLTDLNALQFVGFLPEIFDAKFDLKFKLAIWFCATNTIVEKTCFHSDEWVLYMNRIYEIQYCNWEDGFVRAILISVERCIETFGRLAIAKWLETNQIEVGKQSIYFGQGQLQRDLHISRREYISISIGEYEHCATWTAIRIDQTWLLIENVKRIQ